MNFRASRSHIGSGPVIDGHVDPAFADIVLTLSDDGFVLEVWTRDVSAYPANGRWVGTPFTDLLSQPDRDALDRGLHFLDAGDWARARVRLDLPLAIGRTMPLLVHLDRMEGKLRLTGQDQGQLQEAVARADRLQVALEAKAAEEDLQAEVYRALLSHLTSATLVIDTSTGRILAMTRPAGAMLNLSGGGTGLAISQHFEGRERAAFIDELWSAATAGQAVTAALRSDRGTVTMRPRLARARGSFVLVCELAQDSDRLDDTAPFSALAESSPDGFVCVDAEGTIVRANPSFLRMVGAMPHETLEGDALAWFLLRGSIDLRALTDSGRPRTFTTQLIGTPDTGLPVEVTVADLAGGGHGMVFRDVRLSEITRQSPDDPASDTIAPPNADAVRQVGQVPLRDIVASMTDVIERDCIQAAIDLTQNNRVAAAEMLGLSRQSLYVKLRKFGLLDKSDT